MTREALVEPVPDPTRESLPPPPERFHRPMTVVFGLLFLFVPLIAYLGGDRARPIENRPLADAPSLADGWDFFDDSSTWFTDHLPLRREAIRSNTWISRNVFDEEPSYGGDGTGAVGAVGTGSNQPGGSDGTPYPAVVSGTDGWLYFGEDFELPCTPKRTTRDTVARLARLERMITDSGRRFVFTIAPDKSTIVAEHLPDRYLGKDCSTERKDALWATLAADPLPTYFDLRNALERQEEVDGFPIYTRLDTHWTLRGAAVYARELARTLEPSLWDDTQVLRVGVQEQSGDLARLLGETRTEEVPSFTVVRPGVVGDWLSPPRIGPDPIRLTNSTTGTPLIESPTLLLGDSFTQTARRFVTSLFADVVTLHHQQAARETVAEEIARADLVVFEAVERSLTGGTSSMLSDQTLDAIQRALDRAPRTSSVEAG